MMRLLCIGLLAATVSGCATTGLYNWGDYEEDLFTYYHHPEKKTEVITDFTKYLAKLEAKGQTPPPGMFAEAGTFYLLEGDSALAVEYYRKEAITWPESASMMTAIISNLEGN